VRRVPNLRLWLEVAYRLLAQTFSSASVVFAFTTSLKAALTGRI
jgi:hypothetical protein